MENFENVIFIMAILIGLSAVADKIKLPYPVLLVAVGLFIGFVPVLPDLSLDPDVVFLIFLPPLLYDSATKTSWQEFTASIRTISTLAVTLVFFTTLAVAMAAHYFIPGFSWPLAFVLGAIVSPPDAVAATSITQGLGLNKRVIAILEGESLLNDASALIAYRYAVAAVMTGSFVFWQASLQFLLVAGGGLLIGIVIGYVFSLVFSRIHNNPIVETSLTLLAPFVSYLAAEHVEVSGILAVVSTGLVITWRSPEVFSYKSRMQSRAVWDTVIFLMNGIIFILIGLQLPAIVRGLYAYSTWDLVRYSILISVVTIIVRILWVFSNTYYQQLMADKRNTTDHEEIHWKNVLIVAWTGTRGVVSLATALALPLTMPSGTPFPNRPIILFLAFVVIFATLVLQGLTLPVLIKLLGVEPQPVEREEEKELQLFMARSVLTYVKNELPDTIDKEVQRQIRIRFERIVERLSRDVSTSKIKKTDNSPADALDAFNDLLAAQLLISDFQQELLIKLHKEGKFSDASVRAAEQELDLSKAQLDSLLLRSGS
jgi:CPA1 family monovalent cation:H+ antiporter